MKYKEHILIDYIKAISFNLLIPINIFNYKFKWLLMCDDFIKANNFSKEEKLKVENLSIAIRYE